MTKRKRSILLILMILLFIAVGPAIVFYSQGYRIDFTSKSVVQTGGFYFRAIPRSVTIKINSEDKEKEITKTTDFLFGTAFIENILPKKYDVSVEKSGYHSWQKKLDVERKMVTEIKNLTLIPENPKLTVLMTKINNFEYFPETNNFIIEREADNGEDSIFSIYNPKSQKNIVFFQSSKENLVKVTDLSNQLKKLIIKVNKDEGVEHYLSDIENQREIKLINLPENSKKLSFHPRDRKKLIFLNKNSIYSYNIDTEKIELILNDVLDYKTRGDGIFFYLNQDGLIFKNIESPEKINTTPIYINNKSSYSLFFPNSLELMIQEDNNFYFFNKEKKEFQKKLEKKYDPVTAPNFQKMACFNDHEIKIIFLDNIVDQPQRSYGEKLFLTRFSEKIKNVNWYTSHYLVFTISNQIKVMEIDNRDNINIVDLIEIENPKIFFNYSENKLYILSEGNIFVSNKLIP